LKKNRYDICVNPEEIISPLPPRRVPFEPEIEEEQNQTPSVTTEVAPEIQNPPQNPPKTKPNFKKIGIIAGIAIAALIIIILIVKALTGTKTSKVVTLNYWGLWEEESVMNGIIAEYESKTPNVKIIYKRNQISDYETRLKNRLAKTGTVTTDVPDIFRIHNSWIPMFSDNLAPVPAETVTTLSLANDFFDNYKKDLKVNENYMGIPLMYDGLALFYNKDLLSAAGVEVPKSWWDLETAANKITKKSAEGKIEVAGAALGLVDNVDHWSDIVGLMMKQNGVNLNNLDTANLKKVKDVLTFYTLFNTKDKMWDATLPNSTQMFASGKLAFYFGPSWRIFNLQDLNPNLNFGVAAAPQLPTSDNKLTNINWSTYWFEGVNKDSKNQAEAWKFLEFLASKEGLEKTYQADSLIRPFGQIYPRKSMSDKISTNEKIKPFIDMADSSTGGYLSSFTDAGGVNANMIKYFGDAVNGLVTNSSNSEEIMTTLQSGINQTKQKYKLTF